ncbi:MAG: GNAT family N-acetyltransferase [Ruminococcaceae bacterium]|nr:GNAT family N-acetyltransferase [Oscillospiraceae bacterium]
MMPDDFYVTKADDNDADCISEISRKNSRNPWNKTAILQELNNGISSIFIAKRKTETIGFVIMRITDCSEIVEIAVSSKHRKCGAGRALISKCIEGSKCNSICDIILQVRKSNIGALNFYLKCGFEVLGERRNVFDNPAEDGYIMNLGIEA